MDDLLHAQREEQREQRERTEHVRRAIGRWTELQTRDAEAQELAERHATEREEAFSELQQAFIEAAISWLGERWGPEKACPYCGNTGWSVGTPFEVSLEGGNSLSPHFPVMCDNCGNTVFINAILAGLLPDLG